MSKTSFFLTDLETSSYPAIKSTGHSLALANSRSGPIHLMKTKLKNVAKTPIKHIIGKIVSVSGKPNYARKMPFT
jgi:hypothetical protein